jgi:hypothetical protein
MGAEREAIIEEAYLPKVPTVVCYAVLLLFWNAEVEESLRKPKLAGGVFGNATLAHI